MALCCAGVVTVMEVEVWGTVNTPVLQEAHDWQLKKIGTDGKIFRNPLYWMVKIMVS